MCFKRLKSLEALFLSSCNVTGCIPEWICELTNLRQLDMQQNQLCGIIPYDIDKLQNLLYLNCKDNNGLGGTLPVEQLSRLSKLNRLSIVNTDILTSPSLLRALQQNLPRCKVWN